MTISVHNNKNMILYFENRCHRGIKLPSEIGDTLLSYGIEKRWCGYLQSYIISSKNPLTDKEVEELTLLTKSSGWTLRQERGELSEDYTLG